MDTSAIPVNIAALYNILITLLGLFATFWGINRLVQMFRRK